MSDSLVHSDPRPIGPELWAGPLAFGCWRLVAMSPADARDALANAVDPIEDESGATRTSPGRINLDKVVHE